MPELIPEFTVGSAVTDILQLRSLKPLRVDEVDGAYVIQAEGRAAPTTCPECRVGRLYGHGTQLQSFRDTPSHGKTVKLTVHRRR